MIGNRRRVRFGAGILDQQTRAAIPMHGLLRIQAQLLTNALDEDVLLGGNAGGLDVAIGRSHLPRAGADDLEFQYEGLRVEHCATSLAKTSDHQPHLLPFSIDRQSGAMFQRIDCFDARPDHARLHLDIDRRPEAQHSGRAGIQQRRAADPCAARAKVFHRDALAVPLGVKRRAACSVCSSALTTFSGA